MLFNVKVWQHYGLVYESRVSSFSQCLNPKRVEWYSTKKNTQKVKSIVMSIHNLFFRKVNSENGNWTFFLSIFEKWT